MACSSRRSAPALHLRRGLACMAARFGLFQTNVRLHLGEISGRYHHDGASPFRLRKPILPSTAPGRIHDPGRGSAARGGSQDSSCRSQAPPGRAAPPARRQPRQSGRLGVPGGRRGDREHADSDSEPAPGPRGRRTRTVTRSGGCVTGARRDADSELCFLLVAGSPPPAFSQWARQGDRRAAPRPQKLATHSARLSSFSRPPRQNTKNRAVMEPQVYAEAYAFRQLVKHLQVTVYPCAFIASFNVTP